MSIRWMMGLSFIWILAHGLLSGLFTGEMIGGDEAGLVNRMTYFDILHGNWAWAIPLLGLQILRDIGDILSFNYPFLTGGYASVRVLMGCISVGVVWGLVQTFGPALQGAVTSLFRFGR